MRARVDTHDEVQQELLVWSIPPHVNGKPLKLINRGLLILGLVKVRPAFGIFFVNRNHLVLTRRKLTVLPVNGVLLWTIAFVLKNLLHPLNSSK